MVQFRQKKKKKEEKKRGGDTNRRTPGIRAQTHLNLFEEITEGKDETQQSLAKKGENNNHTNQSKDELASNVNRTANRGS